jgi:hypothetical protein
VKDQTFITPTMKAEVHFENVNQHLYRPADVEVTIETQAFEAADLRALAKKLKKVADKLDRLTDPTFDDGPF